MLKIVDYNKYMSNLNVQDLLNNSNPTKEEIADAYYARDIQMKLEFTDQFQWAMNKLSYDPNTYNQTKDTMVRKKINKTIDDYKKNKNSSNINMQEIEDSVKMETTQLFEQRKQKYNSFLYYLNNKKHREFYNSMDINELSYLGY
tara:strand:+ start:2998 stop:3432 length:435 start_codon:yes stop_codon:yes gene_type:complete